MTQYQKKSYKACAHLELKDFLFFKTLFSEDMRFLGLAENCSFFFSKFIKNFACLTDVDFLKPIDMIGKRAI